MNSLFKNLQSFGVLILVLGLFLAGVWYFYDSIPEIQMGNATLVVMEPPMWSIYATVGGGIALLILGLVGAAADKSQKQEPKQGE